MQLHKVFVYGSLRRGAINDCKKFGGTYVQTDSVEGTLYDLGAFPGWRHEASEHPSVVLGDVYMVDEEALTALDYYESEGFLYRRTKIKTDRGSECFIYEIRKDVVTTNNLQPITCGDWLTYRENK